MSQDTNPTRNLPVPADRYGRDSPQPQDPRAVTGRCVKFGRKRPTDQTATCKTIEKSHVSLPSHRPDRNEMARTHHGMGASE